MRRARAIGMAFAGLLLCSGAAQAQDSTTTAPAPAAAAERRQPAKPFAAFSASASALRDSLVSLARSQVGTRYVFGGTTPKGFDCSGLIRYVMAALDVDLPRTANQQARVGTSVPKQLDELKPGDLLTFGTSRRISHIGIYIGDGKFVHASSVAGRVVERSFDPNLRGQKPWVGVRRILAAEDGDSTAVGNR